MRIQKNFKLTGPSSDASRQKQNVTRLMIVLLGIVIFIGSTVVLVMNWSSHRTAAELSYLHKGTGPETAGAPDSHGSTASPIPGSVDSQEMKARGLPTGHPQAAAGDAKRSDAAVGKRHRPLRTRKSETVRFEPRPKPAVPIIIESADKESVATTKSVDEAVPVVRKEPDAGPRPGEQADKAVVPSKSDLSSRDAGDKASNARAARFPRGAEGVNQSDQSKAASAQVTTSVGPDVVQLVGPVSQNLDLQKLPYIPPNGENDEQRLMRHTEVRGQGVDDPVLPVRESLQPSAMPATIQNFGGITFAQSGCFCLPPDTHGDVGPNHYIQSVNSSIKIFDKTGNPLNGANGTTYNSFFSAMGPGTPCGNNQNQGDGIAFYDHLADRWVVSDFAFPGRLPGSGPFYQCVGVSKTADPVAGGWWLYALQHDPANPTWVGDYPKFGLWPDAYYMSVNLFDGVTLGFNGVRVYALPRLAMINGTGTPNPGAVAFTITPANLGDLGSLLPATFRTGSAPAAGTPEYIMAINSSAVAGTVETQVFTWRFHVDFATPANSMFGIGAGHTPNGSTTVNGFVDAFAATMSGGANFLIVPQNGNPPRLLDTLGDRLMTPLVYQKLGVVESLYASHTVNNNQGGTGPTAIRWYQFNVTGGTIPATPLQQQSFNNGADGLWRWMPSIAVDAQGNMSIGYTASSSTTEPAIKYAGRLVGDPLNSLAQGEGQLIAGGGHQASTSGRWGDYSSLSIDPSDSCTFWHTNEYFSASSDATWNTRIGSFKFPGCSIPTEAKVKSFSADAFDDGRVMLRWSTGYEVDNLGYNVYREVKGERTKINTQMIAGSALVTGPKVALTAGKGYVWVDEMREVGTVYWLEDVDLSGKRTWTGPINVEGKRGKGPSVEQSVLLARVGMAATQMTSGQGSVEVERKAEIASVTPEAMKLQMELAGSEAVKLGVKEEGWYRISQQELIGAGMRRDVDARKLRLYVDGGEVPMIVNGEQDGRLDPGDSIEFYGVGLESAASSRHVYWVVAGGENGARIKATKTVGRQSGGGSFMATVERKDRTLYFGGLRNGETENFFGPVVGGTPIEQTLTLSNIAGSGTGGTLEVYLQGVTQRGHEARVKLNGTVVGTVRFKGQERGKGSFGIRQGELREGENTVELEGVGGSGDISLVDVVRVTYAHLMKADSNQLRAGVNGGETVTIGGFTSTDVRVMDVTEMNKPQELKGTISGTKNNTSITVTAGGSGTRKLLAFTGGREKSAEAKANVATNWRREGQKYDYVMITTEELRGSLSALKELREKEGMRVAVVDVEDVYDEFSYGNKTAEAVKEFLRYTEEKWSEAPRYVLLAGDSSYDPKNYLGYGENDLVPTKLYDSAYMEAASDDWFVDFEGKGVPEMTIGRLPVRNAAEASAMAGKIVGYERSEGANSVLLTTDLNDGYNFGGEGERLKKILPGGMKVKEVERGTSDDGSVRREILGGINEGQTIVNYNGHGSENQWRGNTLTNGDAGAMTNSEKLAMFVLMTCLNGYFDDPGMDSLAESLMKSRGGASAVWASTAQTEPGQQERMNEELYRQLFSGERVTIGEAAARAKQAVSDGDVRRSWILFGDPAMRLR